MAGLRITAVVPGATIQDGGRHGLLRFGVTPAGPMDWIGFQTANLMLDNAPDAAGLEIPGGGLTLVNQDEPLSLAVAGSGFVWFRGDERLPSPARILLQPGESLRARAGDWGAFAYLALPGGVAGPLVMGSRATHLRSGLGGRMLQAGDLLAAAERVAWDDATADAPWLSRDATPIRVVLGPQDDYFSAEILAQFAEAPFTLTPAADRMAYKLVGPNLSPEQDFNIVSDGVALGAIQVAGDGQPMVLMADRQPTGGYPKIGHVIRADIGRLAQLRPGDTCRFAIVTVDAARAALLALEDAVATTPTRRRPLHRAPTLDALLAHNLIGGVVDAMDDGA